MYGFRKCREKSLLETEQFSDLYFHESLLPDLISWGVYTFPHRVLKENLVNGVNAHCYGKLGIKHLMM